MITTWFMISSKTVSRPRASLSAITATTPISGVKPNASVIAAAAARAPCGLCAASSTTVGERRTTSSRPGNRTWANPSRTTSGLSAFRPRKASTAASACAALAAWWAPCSGRKMSSTGPSAPLSRIT